MSFSKLLLYDLYLVMQESMQILTQLFENA